MKNHSFIALFGVLISASLLGSSAGVHAATTDIANAPLASASSTIVKPNIMFILDDSGSMGWDYLPDNVDNNNSKYCYRNFGYNKVYYNPNYTYTPPVDSAGVSYSNATFNSAKDNGFDLSSGASKTNLSSSFKAGNDGSGQAAYYYESNSSTTAPPDTCTGSYSKIVVAAAEQQNFANWYSYYRTRILTMKTSAGKAFKDILDNYRVGFSTIGYSGTDTTNSQYLQIDDFATTQKDSFYSKVYGTAAGGYTPLRAALSKAGRVFAGKLLTGSNNPVQYSCQQNFAILSTDGYWNTYDESSSYGPDKIDGSTSVGNQDGSAVNPLKDGLNKSDTLADVAMYYYQTDLRTGTFGTTVAGKLNNCTGALGTDVCEDNVPGAGDDINPQQHMTTFTLGLGVNGTLGYTDDYLTGGSTDYEKIKQGTLKWPDPIANSGGQRIDDLWHAAVNGRGIYFSAKDPASLVSGLSKALAGVSARTGAASAAATSNLQPVSGDNYAYLALYRTVYWDGDLQKKEIDLSSGAILPTVIWSAQPLLDAKVSASSDTRNIYTFYSVATNKLKSFTYANLSTTEKTYFNNICTTSLLTQCSSLTTAQQTAISGINLVNFLRGQYGLEDQTTNLAADRIYRDRSHVLGDMVNSQPVYLKAPSFDYLDTNYSTYKDTTQKNRAAMVYIAVNDGMLHAFDGATGTEKWAYIPPILMPTLHKLADKNYSSNHHYYADGSPTIVDVCLNAPTTTCTGAQWKSILVGGLNAGGRGYYALDITDPVNPKALWNFTVNDDNDLGYSYGTPIITKLKTGTDAGKWVVIVSSGYNNVSPGSGIGYLFVLDAATGTVLQKISTGTGDTITPSGLGKLNAWVDLSTDNTAERIYGGDLLGNVWRFDINDIVPPSGKEAVLLAQLGQINGAATQSITTKPELQLVNYQGSTYPVVLVGTGRYLGSTDLPDTSKQSIYAIKDSLLATGIGQARATGVLVKQTLTEFLGASNQPLRTTSTNPVFWSSGAGWYVDLDPASQSPGERVNVDMNLQLGILTVAGNVPNSNACNVGGYAWLYYFDVNSGQYLATAADKTAGEKLLSNALVAGVTQIKLSNGTIKTIVTNSDGTNTTKSTPPPPPSGATRRVGWRELIN